MDGAFSPPCQRMGAMVAFQCFDDFKRSLLSKWFILFSTYSEHTVYINNRVVTFVDPFRNFDEVLSSFAEQLVEGASFLESCSSFYEEENMKVGLSFCKCLPWSKNVTCFCSREFLLCSLQNNRENPIHIINVSIRTADTEDDDALVKAFTAFAQSKVRGHVWNKTHFYLNF